MDRLANARFVFQRLVPGCMVADGAGRPGAACQALDGLDGDVPLGAERGRGFEVRCVGSMLRGVPVPRHQHGIEIEPREAAAMHRGDRPAVAGDADEVCQPKLARLHRRVQSAAGRERLIPFVRVDKGMQLDQVDMVGAQPIEGPPFSAYEAGLGPRASS